MFDRLETALHNICRKVEGRGDIALLKRIESTVTNDTIRVVAIVNNDPNDDEREEIEVAFSEIYAEIWSSPHDFVTEIRVES